MVAVNGISVPRDALLELIPMAKKDITASLIKLLRDSAPCSCISWSAAPSSPVSSEESTVSESSSKALKDVKEKEE